MQRKVTAVLGASIKPERHSNQAVRMLQKYGHQVIPVHPVHTEVEGIKGVSSVEDIPVGIDTITVYLNPAASEKLIGAIIAKAPRRVVINPGAESPLLEAALHQAGIEVERACTLVLLQTGQW